MPRPLLARAHPLLYPGLSYTRRSASVRPDITGRHHRRHKEAICADERDGPGGRAGKMDLFRVMCLSNTVPRARSAGLVPSRLRRDTARDSGDAPRKSRRVP